MMAAELLRALVWRSRRQRRLSLANFSSVIRCRSPGEGEKHSIDSRAEHAHNHTHKHIHTNKHEVSLRKRAACRACSGGNAALITLRVASGVSYNATAQLTYRNILCPEAKNIVAFMKFST